MDTFYPSICQSPYFFTETWEKKCSQQFNFYQSFFKHEYLFFCLSEGCVSSLVISHTSVNHVNHNIKTPLEDTLSSPLNHFKSAILCGLNSDHQYLFVSEPKSRLMVNYYMYNSHIKWLSYNSHSGLGYILHTYPKSQDHVRVFLYHISPIHPDP